MSLDLKQAISTANENTSNAEEKFTFDFDVKTRSWRLKYFGWTGKDYHVEFEFERSIYGKSMYLIHKDFHDGLNIGVYLVDEPEPEKYVRGKLITTLRVDFPNLWPDRDPHQAFTLAEMYELYEILMREAHQVWFQRLADGWRNHAINSSKASDFNVKFIKEDEQK